MTTEYVFANGAPVTAQVQCRVSDDGLTIRLYRGKGNWDVHTLDGRVIGACLRTEWVG